MYSECIPNVKINSHSNTNLEGFGNAFHFGKGDGYCRFTDILGMSLTMPNKKCFFDFLLLKTFTGHNIENLSEFFEAKCMEFELLNYL